MHHNRKTIHQILSSRIYAGSYVLALLAMVLLWLGGSSSLAAAQSAGPDDAHDSEAQAKVDAAWSQIETLASYQFRSQVKQQVYPAPSVANAGRPPKEDVLGIAGTFDAATQRMESTLWTDLTFDPESGIDLLVDDGRSYVRQSDQADWEEINDLSGSFAPGGDPFSFLAGMSNVQAAGLDTRALNGTTLAFERFTFELDSVAFAQYVERLTAQMMAENVDLPQGMTPGPNESLRQMSGTGQVWLDDQGNLARLEMDLTTHVEESGELVQAQLVTDYFELVAADMAVEPAFLTAPLQRIGTQLEAVAQPENAAATGWVLLGLALLVLLSLFVWRQAHTKEFYTTIVSLIIMGMVFPPLLSARDVRAFYQSEVARSQDQARQQAEVEERQAVTDAMYQNDWNPQENPLESGRLLESARDLVDVQADQAADYLLTANNSSDEIDSDGDGVSDEYELLWGSCPYSSGSTEYNAADSCSGVSDVADSDDDGLSDYTEILELGTLPYTNDSDGDTLLDTLEVAGFSYNGEQWYLDPISDDTNNDGISDGQECFVWSFSNENQDTAAVCPDTDGDGEPDLFDLDNDGDGLYDGDDEDPNLAGERYDYENPLELSIDGLQTDKPVIVDLQFRPEDTDLLTYNGLVLDWPSGDYEGQHTRGLTTTFATTEVEGAYSEDGNASYGDLRIMPMIEVTMPYSDGHYANLPVNDSYYGIDRTLGLTIGQWIDSSDLDGYGITVSDVDESSGNLTAYLPLSTMYSENGNTPVAFGASMFYSPTQGTNGTADWGAAHEYRLLWMVRMLTDSCVADVDEDLDGDVDNETDGDCTREESYEVIHVYKNEAWQLTSLSVAEHHGLSMAQMYEDPTSDPDLAIDDQLSTYAWNVGNSFLSGLDCDSSVTNSDGSGYCVGDGAVDVSLSDISAKLDEWGTEDGGSTNYNYVEFDGVYDYAHDGYMGVFVLTETARILDTVFLPYVDQQPYTSLLYVYEMENRALGLDSGVSDGNGGMRFDFSAETVETMAGMVWKPYAYDESSAEWAEADSEIYLEYVVNYLGGNDSFFIPEDDSDAAIEESEGRLIWAQSFTASLLSGQSTLVASNGTALNVPAYEESDGFTSFLADFELLYELAFTSGYSRVGTLIYYRMTQNLWTTGDALSVGQYMRLMYSLDRAATAADGLGRYSDYFYRAKTFFVRAEHWAKITHHFMPIIKGSVGLLIVGALLIIAGLVADAFGAEDVGYYLVGAGLVLVAIASTVLVSMQIISMLTQWNGYKAAASALGDTNSGVLKIGKVAKDAKRLARSMAVFSFIISLVIIGAMYFMALHSLGNAPAYVVNALNAWLIVSVVVEVILLVIGLLFPIGTALVAFLLLLDLIFTVINYFTNANLPTLEKLIEVIADWLYQFDLYAANLNDSDRLGMDFEISLVDEELGYVSANTLRVTSTITNTLWTEGFSRSDLRRNSFTYTLGYDDEALADVSLAKEANSGEWSNISYSEYVASDPDFDPDGDYDGFDGVYLTETLVLDIPFVDVGTGVNASSRYIYISERYHALGEGCWVLFDVFDDNFTCEEYSFKDYWSSSMDALVYDIFPDTVGEFADMRWDQSLMKIPDQRDQDGDGLVNRVFNGADPDDTKADTDGDGIWDYYEISENYDADTADGDNDGLDDWAELFQYGTDPKSADSDNDGLSDYIEAKQGWLVGYTDENGTTQVTRVWSNPWIDDLDADGLGDLQEFLYGFHPEIPNNPSDVDNLIEIDDITVDETAGPLFLLKFEDDSGDTVMTDISGHSHSFSCDASGDECPELEVDGVYGDAATFDGSNDHLDITGVDWNLTEFTTAAWIYSTADDGNYHAIMGYTSGGSNYRAPSMYVRDATIHVGFGTGSDWKSITTGDVISTNTWHHVATTFDGNALSVYVDGAQVYYTTNYAGFVPYPVSAYSIATLNNYFVGSLDEVVFYDQALSETEIGEVMDGRYNTNDLIVRPGAELAYQATVTNTSASRNAHGFLYADSAVANPEVPVPDYAFGFETDQRWAYFPSHVTVRSSNVITGNPMACVDDGTCPTAGITGAFGNGVMFDGVDDFLHVPKLSSEINQYQEDDDENYIFFWMYIDEYPASGETAMILDTDSDRPGATDIYIDSSGYLYFELGTYGTGVSTSPISKDQWVHIGYRAFELTIDGGTDGEGYKIFTLSDDAAKFPTFGPGRLGNSLDGSAPFEGRIDGLAIFHTSVSDSELTDHIMQGDYFDSGSGLRADAVFEFEELIANQDGTDVGYQNFITGLRDADCTDDMIECPTVLTGSIYGDGLTLDGVDDGLIIEDIDLGLTDYTIGMWFRTSDVSYQGLFSAVAENGGTILLRLNSNGKVRTLYQFAEEEEKTELRPTTVYADGEWHYITAVKENDTLSLYMDGEFLESAIGLTGVPTLTLNAGIGLHLGDESNPRYFNGDIDELVVLNEAVDEDGVRYLMNSVYPAIDIDTPFTEFSLDALATANPNGLAVVADAVDSGSVHTFAEEVEVSLDFETEPTLTTYYHAGRDINSGNPETDENGTDSNGYTGYFRFEDEPGSTSFDNLVYYNSDGTVRNEVTYIDIPLECLAESCPISGVRGVDGRAIYFDGENDYLYANPATGDLVLTDDGSYDTLSSTERPEVQSLAVWVKGTRGTIFNMGKEANTTHMWLEMGRLSYLTSTDNLYSVDFDMPTNEWVHVVFAINNSGVATVYVDGESVASLDTGDNVAGENPRNWIIGANYGTQDHFLGYMDDLRFYDQQVGASWAERHYSEFVPYIRFEFDEAEHDVVFADKVRGHVATPVYIECVDLSLDLLNVQDLDSTLTNLALDIDGETAYYGAVNAFSGDVTGSTAVSQTLNLSTPICDDTPLTMRGVYSDGTEISFSGSATVAVTTTAATDIPFSEGAQQVTLTYSAGDPYNSTTPIAGTDGRIGNTVYFPGDETGYLEISDSEGLGDFATDDWTLMTWVRTDTGDGNPIFAKDNGDGVNQHGEKFVYINSDGTLAMASKGDSQTVYMDSTEVITDNVWHHVALAWNYSSGTDGTYTMWVDGVNVTDYSQSSSNAYSALNVDNDGDSWKIGRRGTNSSGHRYFKGEMDEFTIYLGRAFGTSLVQETYLREARWYRDLAEFSVLVDDDAPTLDVQTDYPYLSPGNTILVVAPDDATSAVTLVQYGVKGPNDADYSWDTAELCDDSSVVYCPTFFADTQGSYEVIFRLVDSVGNQMTTEVYDYYLDLTPPTISGTTTAAAEGVQVVSLATFDNPMAILSTELSVVFSQTNNTNWATTFGGTVSDPEIESGVAGSGIAENELYVTVYNANGAIVGASNQVAAVDEELNSWTIDYVMSGLSPAGTYSVQVMAADESGNQIEGTLGTFTTDQQAPDVKLAHQYWADQVISNTNVISGVVTDQYDPYGAVLQFHFEEDAGATSFYNYGGDQGLVDCLATCPQAGATALFGYGLDFDGAAGWTLDSDVISDAVNTAVDETFTIAFWMQADGVQANLGETTNSLVEKWDGSGAYPYAIRYHNQTSSAAGYLTASRSDGTATAVVTSTVGINDGAFHHVALVLEDDLLVLYVDGVANSRVTDTTGTAINLSDFMAGHRLGNSNSYFSGILDELSVFDRALTSDEVYALAQTAVNGSNQVEIALEEIDLASYPDLTTIDEDEDRVTWESATVEQSAALGSVWSYTMSDQEMLAYIHVRSQDGGGITSDAYTAWHGLIDHKAPQISLTGLQSGYGPVAKTYYTFSFIDILLDADSVEYPCDSPNLTIVNYDDETHPLNGLPYYIGGDCTVLAHESSASAGVCDLMGHCSDTTITPSTTFVFGAVGIISPTVALTDVVAGAAVEIDGYGYSGTGIAEASIWVDDVLIETFTYGDGSTEAYWTTLNWTPTMTGTYDVSTVLTSTTGATFGGQDEITISSFAAGQVELDEVSFDGNDYSFAWSTSGVPNGCDIYLYYQSSDPYGDFNSILLLASSPVVLAENLVAAGYYYAGSPACTDEVEVSDTMGVFRFELTPGE